MALTKLQKKWLHDTKGKRLQWKCRDGYIIHNGEYRQEEWGMTFRSIVNTHNLDNGIWHGCIGSDYWTILHTPGVYKANNGKPINI